MNIADINNNHELRRIIVIGKQDRVAVDAEEMYKIGTWGVALMMITEGWKNTIEKFIGLKFPMYTISTAKSIFQFPPNHPVLKTAYAMCDVYPNIYVPINTFHEYFHQLKHSSLIKMCADLGAKEIYLEEGFENGVSINIMAKGDLSVGNIGAGVNGGGHKNISDTVKHTYMFSDNNQSVKECDSPWLPFEPSWKMLKEMRLVNHVKSYGVEYTYTEDFGVNAELSASLIGIGLSIGGEYKNMKKYEYKYNVIFW